MARKNRLVVEDGLYHLTTRIAHQEHLLSDPTVKDKIVGWIYDIADFSGVNVCAWNVMDNHLHLYVHVPSVPEKYWLTPPEVGTATVFLKYLKIVSFAPAEGEVSEKMRGCGGEGE